MMQNRYFIYIYINIYVYIYIVPNRRSAAKESAAAAHNDNNKVSNDDFNTMMDKKLNEFKSSIIKWAHRKYESFNPVRISKYYTKV